MNANRMTVLKVSHQDVCQVIFAVVGSVFLSLPVHRQRVVVIFRVLFLEKQKILKGAANGLISALNPVFSPSVRH